LPGQFDLEKAIEEVDHVKGAMPIYVLTNT